MSNDGRRATHSRSVMEQKKPAEAAAFVWYLMVRLVMVTLGYERLRLVTIGVTMKLLHRWREGEAERERETET